MIRCTSYHHPVLFLRGVRVEDLEGILDFMYHGEVYLEEKEIETFLKTAEDLQVRGLCQMGSISGAAPDLDSALEEDVQSLLRTMDEPPSKRIKQEPDKPKEKEKEKERSSGRSAGLLSAFGPGLSISVKQEPRDKRTTASVSVQPPLRSSINASPAGSTGSDTTQDQLKSLLSRETSVTPVKTPGPPPPLASPRTPTPLSRASPRLPEASSPAGGQLRPPPTSVAVSKNPQLYSPRSIPATAASVSAMGVMLNKPNLPQLVQTRPPQLPATTNAVPLRFSQFSSPSARLPGQNFINPPQSTVVTSGTASPPVLHLPETSFNPYNMGNRMQAPVSIAGGLRQAPPQVNQQLVPTSLNNIQSMLAVHQHQQQQQLQQQMAQKQLPGAEKLQGLLNQQQQQAHVQLRQLQLREIQQQVISQQQQQLQVHNQQQQHQPQAQQLQPNQRQVQVQISQQQLLHQQLQHPIHQQQQQQPGAEGDRVQQVLQAAGLTDTPAESRTQEGQNKFIIIVKNKQT